VAATVVGNIVGLRAEEIAQAAEQYAGMKEELQVRHFLLYKSMDLIYSVWFTFLIKDSYPHFCYNMFWIF
jgi:hypothetical protein